jgi:tripartite-type tricarboxylate transporter receptor subunit TctC
MLITRLAGTRLIVGLMLFVTGIACSQDYPNKTIRILTSAAGGGTDFAARIIAQGLSGSLGQPVIVDNRPTITALELASKAPSDGYTLLVAGATLWIIPLLQNVSYDTLRDFSPITFTGSSPLVLVVHPAVAAKSVKELIGLAKAKPGQLNYASGGAGSSANLSAEYFKSLAGVDIVRVSYKGNGPALTALLAGETQMIFITPPPVAPHIKSGRIRALAVTSLQPSELLPGLPTVAASGLPGFEVISIDSVVAPAKTPAGIINRLRQEIVRDINRPEIKQKFLDSGIEIVGNTPAEAAKFIRVEISKWGKVIKDAGIKVE